MRRTRMRGPLPYLLIAAALGVCAALMREPSGEERLQAEADRLQQWIAEATVELGDLCGTTAGMLTSDSTLNWHKLADRSDALGPDGIELLARWDDIRYWTSSLPLDEHALDTTVTSRIRSGSSVYLHTGVMSPRGSVHALRLLWFQPPFENRYLQPHFHPSLGVASGVVASVEPGLGPVVRDPRGEVLFRLHWVDDAPPPGARAWARLLAVSIGAAMALIALWSWLVTWVERGRRWPSIVTLLLLVSAFRWWGLSPALRHVFEGFTLFAPNLLFASAILPSLGDLVITVALVVFICAFIRRATAGANVTDHPGMVAVIGLITLLVFAAWINDVMIALVRDSQIPLDLFHAQSLDVTSAVTLFAIAFLLFAWVLLADAFTRWVSPHMKGLVLVAIATVVFGAAHLAYHLVGVFDSVLVLWPLPLLVALALMRRGGTRFTNALVMITALALLSVHILNRQTFKRMERDREALAESAGKREDPMIEWLFREARAAISQDAEARSLLVDTAHLSATELDTRIRQRFFEGTWNNYDVRIHLFGPSGLLRATTARGPVPTLIDLRARFEQGVPVEGDIALRNVHRPTEAALYLGAIGQLEGTAQSRLILELFPRVLPEGLGFPELLMAGDRAVDRRADRYARAHYERGRLVESSGAYAFPTRWSTPIPSDGLVVQDKGFELLASGDAATEAVVIGSALPTWIDHVTTFSYLFLFFSFLGAAFLLLRAGMAWRGIPPFNLSAKLRAGIMLFAGIAIVLFAFGAQRLLGMNYADRVAQQLNERSRSAIAELRHHVHLEDVLRPDMRRDLDYWTDMASDVLLTDISAYSPSGELIATSREQVFSNGLLGTRMDPRAYVAMAVDHLSAFAHEEHIGDAAFQAAYRPLLNDRGDVLAYLSVPYFARQSEVDDERTAGYVAIVNLFVLLFLLSTLAAGVIANWTTRPLLLLKRGLERIQLGARNEPLPYQGEDELGELVRVYNRKVDELRESAEKLARSERESAWREMARQVAHEIKNPLTPMKLGIQHFQLTWDPKAPDAKERLDRFATSMVEQIDALSRVAGDFSRFAQMSAAKETVLDLNEVARNAVALFAGTPNADIALHASTDGPLRVKADREHLLRVLNNLIKNATQAIPEDRQGVISVSLRAEGDQAIVEVRDNGTGIPEEVRERIFEPSFTTKSGGMGLGLAMVKRMVEQAGGSVHFTTRMDEGSSFVVSLPLVR
ncbi:MAG: HAMP domain-containing protein [Flavobacteriales bacterium]|nr:HAMP domain-containing protein [Flavobacteriales bacterium]